MNKTQTAIQPKAINCNNIITTIIAHNTVRQQSVEYNSSEQLFTCHTCDTTLDYALTENSCKV